MNDESRTEGDRLVDLLADGAQREAARRGLEQLGEAALPALRAGLRHGDWRVRMWCAIELDHRSDPLGLLELVPLLRDPKSRVRMWAVHSLSCERCHPGANPVDALPLLVERIEHDDSIRVRRMATVMLAWGAPDARAVPLFESLLCAETDAKILLHAKAGLRRCREALAAAS